MLGGLLKNKFVRSIGSYTLVNVINKGIPFLLLPLLTHFLSTEDYGVLRNVESLLVISVTLVGVNLPSALTRQYVKRDVDLKSYFTSAFRIVIISFCLLTITYSVFADVISEYTSIPISIVYFITFYALCDSVMEVLMSLWRMEDKPFNYGAYRITRTLIEVVISLVAVIIMDYDWIGRYAGLYIGGVIGGVVAIFIFLKRGFFGGSYTTEYKKHFLNYGLPLIPHSVSGVIIFYSDKIVITKMIGVSENGLYSVAFTIGMAISLLQNSFNQAWVPWLFKKLELESLKEKKRLVKITYIYMLVMLLFVLSLWLITPFIYAFLGKDFSEGMGLVVIIGLGFAFNGMYKMMINYVFYAEKNKIISTITIFMAILNITLNVIFIKSFGLVGSAYASVITFFIQFIITWYISNKVFPMPWFSFKR